MTLFSGDIPIRQVEVEFPIVDDEIVEPQQSLVGYIEIANAVDIDTITLGRTATRLIINDNDGKTYHSYKKLLQPLLI